MRLSKTEEDHFPQPEGENSIWINQARISSQMPLNAAMEGTVCQQTSLLDRDAHTISVNLKRIGRIFRNVNDYVTFSKVILSAIPLWVFEVFPIRLSCPPLSLACSSPALVFRVCPNAHALSRWEITSLSVMIGIGDKFIFVNHVNILQFTLGFRLQKLIGHCSARRVK
jgi:hypothetical protein